MAVIANMSKQTIKVNRSGRRVFTANSLRQSGLICINSWAWNYSCKIAISLVDPDFGEQSAQTGEIAINVN